MRPEIHHIAEVTSTNDEARRRADAGAPEGTVVWADHQTAGRGRQGRTWHSSRGENLLLSVVLRPDVGADRLGAITLMGAVAVAESIAIATDLEARLKWPNDVLIRGRKVSGMLLESAQDPGASTRFVILGVGINVNQTSFPSELEHTATSLRIESGLELSRHELVEILTGQLDSCYDSLLQDGGTAVRERYMARLVGLGEEVTVHDRRAGRSTTGRMVDVATAGALELETSDGRHELFYAGDVTLRPAPLYR